MYLHTQSLPPPSLPPLPVYGTLEASGFAASRLMKQAEQEPWVIMGLRLRSPISCPQPSQEGSTLGCEGGVGAVVLSARDLQSEQLWSCHQLPQEFTVGNISIDISTMLPTPTCPPHG